MTKHFTYFMIYTYFILKLRKRHAKFPSLEKDLEIKYMQPATLAHMGEHKTAHT